MALDNYTRQAEATDVGFKISKPGYDASRTAGSNLIFSSSWPGLQVLFSKTITNPLTGHGASSTLTHNLQFPCLTFVWAYGPDPSGRGNCTRRLALAGVDKTTVYLTTNGLSSVDTDFLFSATHLHIKCTQLDLSQDIDYILAPGDTFKAPYDPNYGFKVVLPGKDINSKDLRDFSVHSRAQSPLILAVKTQETTNTANPTTVQYSAKTPHPVWIYGFVKSTANRYRPASLGGQSYPRTFTDGYVSSVTYQTSSGDNGATLVVLRDPMFAATDSAITY